MLAVWRCYTELVFFKIPTSTWLLMTKVSFRFFVRMPPKSKILEPRGYWTTYLPKFSGRSSISISGACIRQITYKLRLSNRFSLVRSYFTKFTLRSSNFKSGGTSASRLHKPLTIFINGLLSLLTLWVEQSRIAFIDPRIWTVINQPKLLARPITNRAYFRWLPYTTTCTNFLSGLCPNKNFQTKKK